MKDLLEASYDENSELYDELLGEEVYRPSRVIKSEGLRMKDKFEKLNINKHHKPVKV